MEPNDNLMKLTVFMNSDGLLKACVYLSWNFKNHIFPEPDRNVALSWVILWRNHHFRANYLASFFKSYSSVMSKSYPCLPSAPYVAQSQKRTFLTSRSLSKVIYQKLQLTISGLSGSNRSPRKYIKEQFYAMLYIASKLQELSFLLLFQRNLCTSGNIKLHLSIRKLKSINDLGVFYLTK